MRLQNPLLFRNVRDPLTFIPESDYKSHLPQKKFIQNHGIDFVIW